MECENILRLVRGLDKLTERLDAQKYLLSNVPERQKLAEQTGQLDALKYLTCDVLEHLKGGDIVIIDNRYLDYHYNNPYNKPSTYVGFLEKDFIPANPIVLDEHGPRIKIRFQPKTLKRLAYIAEDHATSLRGIPWSVDSIYPSSRILFGYDQVSERLKLERTIDEDFDMLIKNR